MVLLSCNPVFSPSKSVSSQNRTAVYTRGGRLLREKQQCRTQAASEESATEAPSTTCQTCGISLDKAPRGCDRQGRVAGGLGAVLGFDWWPIKAYRPCPELSKGGFNYIRKGQITEAIFFPQEKERKQ